MANIYAYYSTTIIMPGGVIRAHHLEDEAFWHTRAWTLQETIESVGRGRSQSLMRYMLMKWPFIKGPFKGKNHFGNNPV
jgi:hypothetical protein